MALKVKNLELPDKSILDEAYLRIQNIHTSNVDYEFLKPSDIEGFELETSWKNRIETKVTVFVWADEIARKNRVPALHWFIFEMDYDLSEWTNIYEQAYYKLKEIYPEGEDD